MDAGVEVVVVGADVVVVATTVDVVVGTTVDVVVGTSVDVVVGTTLDVVAGTPVDVVVGVGVSVVVGATVEVVVGVDTQTVVVVVPEPRTVEDVELVDVAPGTVDPAAPQPLAGWQATPAAVMTIKNTTANVDLAVFMSSAP